jgi:hypothetical protein
MSVEAVGWIPYYQHLNDIPHNAYFTFASESRRNWIACDLLFYSGNTPNPEEEFLQKYRSFAELLHSKNYRGALSLRDIKLYCHDDGTYFVKCTPFRKEEHIGFTPYRLLGLRSKKVLHFSKGVGSVIEPSIVYTPTGARLSYEVQFRIGRVGNLGVKFLTKCWAPDMWLRVDYELNRDGTCTIAFSGSRIPSSVHYVSGRDDQRSRIYYHDMEQNNSVTIRNLITSKKSGRADGNYYHPFLNEGWGVDE